MLGLVLAGIIIKMGWEKSATKIIRKLIFEGTLIKIEIQITVKDFEKLS
jgi:hypothetical protein